MIIKSFSKALNGLKQTPAPVNAMDMSEAYSKIERIVSNATMITHVEAAERMLTHLSHRIKEPNGVLLVAMQEKINARRNELSYKLNPDAMVA